MAIRRYVADDHDLLNTWLKQRDRRPWDIALVPKVGFVYSHNEEPVAMGFIRQVEGNFCMLDGLISNPRQPSEVRHVALDAVVSSLINTAKDLGYISMVATTVDKDILTRSVKHGFVQTQHSFISLDLGAK